MLAWDGLTALDAYQVTEIPRRPDTGPAPASAEPPNDPGRTQRVAALVAAYHSGAGSAGAGSAGAGSAVGFGPAAGAGESAAGALAIGWIRHRAGGPVRFLVAGA
jgi:hypothetical protein